MGRPLRKLRGRPADDTPEGRPTWYEKFRAFVAKRLLDFSSYFLTEFPEEEWAKIKAAFAGMRLPVIELLCPRDPEAEHPITPKRLAEWRAKRSGGTTPPDQAEA